MGKLVAAFVLTGALVLLLCSGPDMHAQVKGARGTIELVESRDGKFRFTVRGADGKYVGGSSVGHATEKEARAAAEELKKVMATATYVSKKSGDSKKSKD
jgi:hypothetical protein